jgi:hypothetical protein
MSTFVVEWSFVLGMLVGLGLVGGCVLVPFGDRLPFAMLAAPFAGLLVLAFGASLAYNLLGLPLFAGVAITVGLGALATGWRLRRSEARPCWPSVIFQLAVAALLAAAITPITTSATILLGQPAIQASIGSDHLGYSHMADWIVAHPPWEHPRVDPGALYESWPAAMFTDPRFGTFATLGTIAMLRGSTSLFAYDSTCAVVLTVTILGVAAVFARGRFTLIVLVLGLVAAHWYDYPRTGYLAKAIGFPAAFFVAGLFMQTCAPLRPDALVALALLAAGTFSVYWAEAPGVYVGLLCAGFIVARAASDGRFSLRRPIPTRSTLRGVWQHAVVLGLMAAIAFLVRNLVAETPAWGISNSFLYGHLVALVNPAEGPRYVTPPWDQMLLASADLEHQAARLTGLDPEVLTAALLFSGLCWLVVAGVAWYHRDPVAMALTLGPMVFLAFLAPNPSPSAQWTFYQLPGTFFALALCAAAQLVDGAIVCPTGRRARLLAGSLALLALINVGLRVPRFLGVVDRYAGKGLPLVTLYSKDELDGLAAAIGGRTARVDIEQAHLSYVVLLELVGHRGIDVQWAPSSWRYVFGYRPWPGPPGPAPPADFILKGKFGRVLVPDGPGATTVFETRQYRLVRPPAP